MSMYYTYVGTYSPEDQDGIHLLALDTEQGSLNLLQGFAGIESPSFLTIDAKRHFLYAASETVDGSVVSYRLDPSTGLLEEISRQKTQGDHPCHLSVDESGRWLLAVNYSSGNVCVYPIDEQGAIEKMSHHVQHAGSSVRLDRQEAPHPHSIFPMPQSPFWIVPDLGCDALFVYKLDPINGTLELQSTTPTEGGAGPRHVVFHPTEPWVYAIGELDSKIAAYQYSREDGSLTALQTVCTLPKGYDGESYCADIHIDPEGQYLYGSNRGHDSVAVFRIQANGTVSLAAHTGTEGAYPRNFALAPDGTYLLAANQNSDSVTLFKLNEGIPEYTGVRLEIPNKPVCLKLLGK
ncbi:lactonase family protein [Paenibacillus sp. UMB4589-SE434]|uniref:lactonase family protein n=1 Tax=Paenibacillus sp. UMB4589-SE434 TaxID=3046314 RepID=UPI00254C12EE|nr:lactonase family protein [Paenibacillus sp. UMB4589-SE434]MDK8181073.1 lactonase family protein [Paenibacillus sp. UMB4589-SE434]